MTNHDQSHCFHPSSLGSSGWLPQSRLHLKSSKQKARSWMPHWFKLRVSFVSPSKHRLLNPQNPRDCKGLLLRFCPRLPLPAVQSGSWTYIVVELQYTTSWPPWSPYIWVWTFIPWPDTPALVRSNLFGFMGSLGRSSPRGLQQVWEWSHGCWKIQTIW